MSTSRFLAGAVVGLVAGLLLAPDKGAQTRENLANTASRWRERLNQLASNASTSLDDLRDYLEQDIDGLPEDVRNRILTILDEAEEMAYNPRVSHVDTAGGVL